MINAPIIGITTSRQLSEHGYPLLTITEAYVAALARSGACPVLIPLGLTEDRLDALLDRIDGILFSGGGDVHPDRYNSLLHPLVANVDHDRDRVEVFLLNASLQKNLPILGICRGLQLMNIAMGGTIYEDILDQRPDSIQHSYFPGKPRDYLAHSVEIAHKSRLAQILEKQTAQVNSLHHQGIKDLAPGLKASAFASDGLIEAFEISDYRFGLAVQWHPEWLPEEANMDILFRELIQAARE